MKTLLKITLAVGALIMLCSAGASAQKLGFIDSGALISSMPEIADVRAKMEAYGKDLDEAYELMVVEFNNKLEEYTKSTDLSDAVKQVKEGELNSLRQRIQEFEQNAAQQIQEQQRNLMAPLMTKAREAIDKVSQSNGFTMVFDVTSGAIAYHNASQVTDLLPLVQAELGITAQ